MCKLNLKKDRYTSEGYKNNLKLNYSEGNINLEKEKNNNNNILNSTNLNELASAQNPILFNPELEYDSLPDATYSNLGSHTCVCIGASQIKENKEASYVIYPNPANKGETVSIGTNNAVKNIVLINSLGEKVSHNKTISTADLAKGVYIVNIEFINGKSAETKLIVE